MSAVPGPRFTVIVAVFNGRSTVERCLDSVRAQRYPHVDLVVQDGGSTDGTAEVLRAREAELFHWQSARDAGIYDAWNRALPHARGDWVLFLGADDELAGPDALAEAAARLGRVPDDVLVAYGRSALVNDEGEELDVLGAPWPRSRRRLRGVMSLPHQAVFHRPALFDRFGVFDPSYRIAGDYALLARALEHADAADIGDLVVARMAHGGVSTTPRNALRVLAEYRRAQRERRLVWPGWAWIASMGRVRTRLLLWSVLGEPRARRVLDAGRRLAGGRPVWTRTA